MAIKEILLHLSDDPRNEQRMQLAFGLADKHEAHVSALYTLPLPSWPATAEGYIPVDLIEKMSEAARERAERMRQQFEAQCRKQAIKGEWRLSDEDALLAVPQQGRYADLIIVGQVDEEADDEKASGIVGLPEEAVLGSGRPVLIVPYTGRFRTLGRRSLIAWDGSREAGRAVHDALPILTRGQRAIVYGVNPDSDNHLPGADIATHLARHGVKTEVQHTVAADIGVGDALLGAVADLNIDLLVMGCYGHSRLREFVLGGATRQILRHMTVPVLMSH